MSAIGWGLLWAVLVGWCLADVSKLGVHEGSLAEPLPVPQCVTSLCNSTAWRVQPSATPMPVHWRMSCNLGSPVWTEVCAAFSVSDGDKEIFLCHLTSALPQDGKGTFISGMTLTKVPDSVSSPWCVYLCMIITMDLIGVNKRFSCLTLYFQIHPTPSVIIYIHRTYRTGTTIHLRKSKALFKGKCKHKMRETDVFSVYILQMDVFHNMKILHHEIASHNIMAIVKRWVHNTVQSLQLANRTWVLKLFNNCQSYFFSRIPLDLSWWESFTWRQNQKPSSQAPLDVGEGNWPSRHLNHIYTPHERVCATLP